MLAAYERARRALRGECKPNSRAGKVRTNISNEPSANIVKMREVCSRPRRLRQNKKDRQKRSFWSKRRVSEAKTVDNCLWRRARAKQGVSGAKNSRVRRLCLRAVGEPLGVRGPQNKNKAIF